MSKLSKLSDVLAKYANDPLFPDGVALKIGSLTFDGDSLLHRVCLTNDVEAARILIDSGVQVNLKGDMGSTPLHNAVEHSDLQIVKLLLEAGADPFIENEFKQDCVAWARSCGNEQAAKVFESLKR